MMQEHGELNGSTVNQTPVAPVSGRPGRRAWLSQPELRARLGGRRLLVVSRDVESAGRIFVALGHLGCKVRIARLASQLPSILAETKAEICVIDADDADGEAPALFRDLHGPGLCGDALFVALLANESVGRKRRLRQMGFHGVLSKPVDSNVFPQELVQALALDLARTPPAR